MLNPLLLIGGATAALLLLGGKKGSAQNITPMNGPSGHKWEVELVGRAGLQGSYIVYEPAMPPVHARYPVMQFSQTGDDPGTRQLVSRFPSVPADIYKQAITDFKIKETF